MQDLTELLHAVVVLLDTTIFQNSVLKKGTVHAEIDLMLRLPKLRKRRNLHRIDITVVQVLGNLDNYRFSNSKPCINCLRSLQRLSAKKGYRVGNIYYFDNNSSMIKTTLNKLLIDDHPYVSRGSK